MKIIPGFKSRLIARFWAISNPSITDTSFGTDIRDQERRRTIALTAFRLPFHPAAVAPRRTQPPATSHQPPATDSHHPTLPSTIPFLKAAARAQLGPELGSAHQSPPGPAGLSFNMCDNPSYALQSSIFIWALSLIPGSIFFYVILALVCASLVIYADHRIRPSTRLSRLNDALAGATEILARAKSDCLRDLLDLADKEARLLQ
ncbi:hypothetical protein FB451DRAFT_1558066 [Mycena latifolia]|nr:hypothetical protein FB451DRAFT_1558066 [Mycena latifolia]